MSRFMFGYHKLGKMEKVAVDGQWVEPSDAFKKVTSTGQLHTAKNDLASHNSNAQVEELYLRGNCFYAMNF